MREFLVHSFVLNFFDACFSTSLRECDACHLGSGGNPKVWLQSLQSPVISPSLSPRDFAIHPVLKEAYSPPSFTDKGGEAII